MYIEGKNKVEKSATKDEVTVNISAIEVENGYIVKKSITGRKAVKNASAEDGKEWFEEESVYISSKNPFDSILKDEITVPDLSSVMSMSLPGKIKV